MSDDTVAIDFHIVDVELVNLGAVRGFAAVAINIDGAELLTIEVVVRQVSGGRAAVEVFTDKRGRPAVRLPPELARAIGEAVVREYQETRPT